MENPFQIINHRLSNIEALLLDLKHNPERNPVNPSIDEEKPFNVDQAADFLGIASQTLYQNVKRIPHVKRFGKLYFFRSQLIAYLEEGKQQKTAKSQLSREGSNR